MDTTEPTLPGIPRGRHARDLAALREADPTGADEGVDRHPLADRFLCPSWDHPGSCICGASLPPMSGWKNPGSVWTSTTCPTCGRCYVDEETFIAIYDDGCEDEE